MNTIRTRTHTPLLKAVVLLLLFFGLSFRPGTCRVCAAGSEVRYIAHRGLSAEAPENTLAALRLAASKNGFYGVEFDVWESAVQKDPPLFLVMHDRNTKRMCGKRADIRSLTRADLRKYKITNGRNIQNYPGQRIPTLEQALHTIRTYSRGAVPVIELKNRLSARGLNRLLRLIGKQKAVIISFDLRAVSDAAKRIRKKHLGKYIRTMYLRRSLPRSRYASMARRLKKAKISGISLRYTAIRRKTVKTFHKAGIEVCAWTIPDRETAGKYRRMGVDYITCNRELYP